MCRVLENDISHYGGHCAIFLHKSEDHRYYWAEKGKPKEYIGCAKSYEEERKMKERLSEFIKMTNLRMGEKKEAKDEEVKSLEPCQIGSKWGLRDGNKRVVVPPIYRTIRKENSFFVFEQLVNHWGVMDNQGKVMIQPKYDKVKVAADGMAILSDLMGNTQTINLR